MVYVALVLSGHMLAYKMDPVSRNLTFVESAFIDRGTSNIECPNYINLRCTGLDNIDVDENGLLWVSAHPKIVDVFMYMFNQTELSPFRVWKQLKVRISLFIRYRVKYVELGWRNELWARPFKLR